MSFADDSKYREIVAKAVCGKGSKYSKATHTVNPLHRPSSILGCWIINHDYKARKDGDAVEVEGSYDINLWYSYNKNTKTEVVTDTVKYSDVIPLKMRDDENLTDEYDVVVRTMQQPNCLEATISPNGQKILVEVEREFIGEVIGETKLCVRVDPDGCVDELEESSDYDLDEEFEDLDADFLLGELDE
ncbi:outer spore coat protein CotE [Pueribacillus sp. YX66]|uniref:outer spore coat protein CotE n=1 Tax=Pueribacillus sp. YX66 TaxID=3229242 RepID=UPI00358D2A8E